MKMLPIKTIAIIAFSLVSFACVKTDYSLLSDDYVHRPDVSFPMGYSEFNVADKVDEYGIEPNVEQFTVMDTLPFNAEAIFHPLEVIEKMMYRVYFKNGYAGRIHLQAFYMDEKNNEVGTVFSDEGLFIDVGTVDDSLQVVKPFELVEDIYLEHEDILALEPVKRIIVEITVLDFSEELRKKAKDYIVNFNLGIEVRMDIGFI